MGSWSDGGEGTTVVLWIKRRERGSWARVTVRLVEPTTRGVSTGAMRELSSQERFPVTWEGDDDTKELIAAR
jgi:hypothetical protein